jgi:uncharacterized protein
MGNAIKTVSPLTFFILTYILSWTIWIVLIIGASQIPEGVSNIVRLFGVLMPAVSALALTIHAKRSGINELFARFKIWRVGSKWWFAVVLIYPGMLVAAGLIYNFFVAGSVNLMTVTAGTLIANIIFLSIATLGEEIGWRGVALPALQKKYSPLSSSLLLGLLWSVWHLPFWLLIGTLTQFGSFYFIMNFLFIIPTTFFITWFFNNTNGSMLLPTVFHVVFNVVNVAIFPVTGSIGAFGIFIVMQFTVMLGVIPSLRKGSYHPNGNLPTATT